MSEIYISILANIVFVPQSFPSLLSVSCPSLLSVEEVVIDTGKSRDCIVGCCCVNALKPYKISPFANWRNYVKCAPISDKEEQAMRLCTSS